MDHLLQSDTVLDTTNGPTGTNMHVGLDLETLDVAKFYRNRMGGIVFIVGDVLPGNKWYDHGFHFIDHRGSYYTKEGSTNSRIWQLADLICLVEHEDVTDDEMTLVHNQSEARVIAMDRYDRIHSFIRKLYPF